MFNSNPYSNFENLNSKKKEKSYRYMNLNIINLSNKKKNKHMTNSEDVKEMKLNL